MDEAPCQGQIQVKMQGSLASTAHLYMRGASIHFGCYHRALNTVVYRGKGFWLAAQAFGKSKMGQPSGECLTLLLDVMESRREKVSL